MKFLTLVSSYGRGPTVKCLHIVSPAVHVTGSAVYLLTGSLHVGEASNERSGLANDLTQQRGGAFQQTRANKAQANQFASEAGRRLLTREHQSTQRTGSRIMVSKCANPTCSNVFHYFGQGTVFEIRFNAASQQPPSNAEGKSRNVVEHFWLCSACSSTLTLATDPERKVLVIPRRRAKPARAAIAIAS